MPKSTTKGPNKLLFAVGGLAAVFIIVTLLKDPVLGMLTQQSDEGVSAVPLVKVTPDLPVVPAPLPVQKKALSAQNIEVVAQVEKVKDAQQFLALATIEGQINELSHKESIRMIELAQQQLSLDIARTEAAMVEEELSKVSENLTEKEAVSEKSPTTSVKKTTVMPTQKPVVVKKPNPMLLGVLSDGSAVLWFDNRQMVLSLTQSEGPLTLVSTSQSDKKAKVLFYGKPLTLHLSPAPTRPKKADQSDSQMKEEE
jgi:hypothetical protein